MKSIPILVYHRVCADNEWFPSSYVVPMSVFQRQMEFLVLHRWRSASISDLFPHGSNSAPATKQVVITFDDGYEDTYTNAFPVLKSLGLTATVFLVGDMSRRVNWWDIPLGVPEAPLLRPDQIAHMAEEGIEFGSHTMTHTSLPALSDGQLQDELLSSKRSIEGITRRAVLAFSYPFSHVDERSKRAVHDAGYRCGFAVNSGPLRPQADPWEIRRINVTASAQGTRLSAKLNGSERCLMWTWWMGKRVLRIPQANEVRRGF